MALFAVLVLEATAGAGGYCWSGVRKKYCWLAGGWRRLLKWRERKTLLAAAGADKNRVTCYVTGHVDLNNKP